MHPDGETLTRHLQGLHHIVPRRLPGHHEAVAEAVRRLVVRGEHLDIGAEQPAEQAVAGQLHVVGQVPGPVRPVRGQVLRQRAAARHGQHVQAAADREERHPGLDHGAHQHQLEPVPAVLGQVGLVQPLLVVQRRVQVPAAGEDHSLQPGDEGTHRIGRYRRQHDGRSPGPFHCAGIADGRDHGLPEPVPPASRIKFAGDADDWATHYVLPRQSRYICPAKPKVSCNAPRSQNPTPGSIAILPD